MNGVIGRKLSTECATFLHIVQIFECLDDIFTVLVPSHCSHGVVLCGSRKKELKSQCPSAQQQTADTVRDELLNILQLLAATEQSW